jgi:TRAP-type C4-dicarboxylate transport system permease small subunit
VRRSLKLLGDGIADVLAVVTAVLLCGLGFLITYSVLLRYYLHRTIGWVTEVSEYTLYAATLLGTAWVLKHDNHVRIDFLVNALRARQQLWLSAATSLIGGLVCLVFAYYGVVSAYELYVRGVRVVKFMALPKYIFVLLIPGGLLLTAVQFALKTWQAMDSLRAADSGQR